MVGQSFSLYDYDCSLEIAGCQFEVAATPVRLCQYLELAAVNPGPARGVRRNREGMRPHS